MPFCYKLANSSRCRLLSLIKFFLESISPISLRRYFNKLVLTFNAGKERQFTVQQYPTLSDHVRHFSLHALIVLKSRSIYLQNGRLRVTKCSQ